MLIRARAPLRLGLAGGGTDVSPYCDTFGGYVLNTTIDRYAYATIRLLEEPIISLKATDQLLEKIIPLSEPPLLNGELDLHKSVYKVMIERFNNAKYIPLELSTFCDAPIGSGLGSSSTLVVVMIRAFIELFNLPLDDYAIAQLAFEIEREHCGLQGGRQDQYSATFGGFNFMEFYKDHRTVINSLRIKNWIICELEASLVLFYMGVSRESAKIIAEQTTHMNNKDYDALDALHQMKQEALTMKECLLRGDFLGIVRSMQQGWENKKRTANAICTPLIEEIYTSALNAGALAGKISGAGGGGFMIFFVPPNQRMSVIRALNRFDGQISNCHFTKHGTQAWRV